MLLRGTASHCPVNIVGRIARKAQDMAIGIYKKMARDIMTKSVATVRENETLHDALMLMTENRLTALPVVDSAGRCLGMISQSDVIAVAREADAENEELGTDHPMADVLFGRVALDEVTNERIDDIMTEGVVTAAPTDLITTVADKMLAEKVHHLPICDEEGCLVGIISTMDILAAFAPPSRSKQAGRFVRHRRGWAKASRPWCSSAKRGGIQDGIAVCR